MLPNYLLLMALHTMKMAETNMCSACACIVDFLHILQEYLSFSFCVVLFCFFSSAGLHIWAGASTGWKELNT